MSSPIAEHRKRIVQQIKRSQNVARENIQKAQQKMKIYYDQTAREPQFEVAQRVWVYTLRVKQGLSKKRLHLWFGPYRLVERMSPVHYRLRTSDNRQVTTMVRVNRMKPYLDPADRPINPPEEDDITEPCLDIIDLPDNIFNAEKILKSRLIKGKIEYVVKWANYHKTDATWGPEANILDFHTSRNKNNTNKKSKNNE